MKEQEDQINRQEALSSVNDEERLDDEEEEEATTERAGQVEVQPPPSGGAVADESVSRECEGSKRTGDSTDNGAVHQEYPLPASQQQGEKNHNDNHKTPDDIVHQKFHSIPTHPRMGATSTVRQRLNGSSDHSQQQSEDEHHHHRKFAAIPTHERAGLGHWGRQQQQQQQQASGGNRRRQQQQQQQSSLNGDGGSGTISQPGAFLVSESSSQQQGGGGHNMVVQHQQQTRPASCTTKFTCAASSSQGSLINQSHHPQPEETTPNYSTTPIDPTNYTNPQTTTTTTTAIADNNSNNEAGAGLAVNYSQQRPPPPVEQHEEEEAPPMIVAELVEPPVEAVQVIFDEGNDQLRMDPTSIRLRQQLAQQQQQQNINTHNTNMMNDPGDDIHKSNKRLGFIGLFFLVLILCVGIPLAVSSERKKEADEGGGAAAANEEETTPIVYPYECYTSTSDLVQAQMDQPNTTQFILCPNSQIKIGEISNPTTNETSIINGDLPLMVLRDNIHILCGLDGARANKCVLEGGIAQVLMQSTLPTLQNDQYYHSTSNHNVSFRGITFTGSLSNDYTLSSGSVVASNRGKNISFIDCVWENMTALAGVVFEGNNLYQYITKNGLLEPHSTELIVENCTFRNIIYDRTFFGIDDQTLILRRCRFEDIRLPKFVSFCTDHGIGEYCHGLVYCELSSHCKLHDICIDGFQYAGLSAVVAAGHRAKVTLSGTNSIVGLQNRLTAEKEQYQQQQQQKSCDSGFSRFWEDDMGTGFGSVCISQQTLNTLWTSTTTCSLDSEFDQADLSTTVAPTHDYDCYTSTFEMDMAQVEHPEQTLFIMCPNTTIRLGMLGNPANGEWDILDGDFPMVIVRSDVEVRCGLDGSVDNNCVVDGGIVQLLMSPIYPNGLESNRTDNVTIRGLTFTGIITAEGTFSSGSVIASNPGRNIQLVDCLWDEISVPQDLVFVGSNNYQVLTAAEDDWLLEAQVVDLTIVNSTFRNVVYAGSLLSSWKQNLTVSRTRFKNIRLSPFFGRCGVPWLDVLGWCQTMTGCFDGGSCSLQDVCVEGLQFAGQAPILLASPDSEIQLSGFHYVNGTKQIEHGSPSEICSSGLGWVDKTGQEVCMSKEDNNVTLNIAATCFLD